MNWQANEWTGKWTNPPSQRAKFVSGTACSYGDSAANAQELWLTQGDTPSGMWKYEDVPFEPRGIVCCMACRTASCRIERRWTDSIPTRMRITVNVDHARFIPSSIYNMFHLVSMLYGLSWIFMISWTILRGRSACGSSCALFWMDFLFREFQDL